MLEITKIAEEIVNFLLINGLDPPTSVTEYDVIVARKMRKFHRATLSHNNIKCVDLLKLIDPEYVDTNKNQMFGFGGYREKALQLGLSAEIVDPNILESKFTQKHQVKLTCMSCGFTDLISGTSLTRRKNGCKKCTKAAPWIHRVEELSEISKSKNLEVLKNNGVGKDILLKCTICHTEFFRAFSTLVYKKTTECPSCHPPKVYGKLGITSIIDNIEFDSNLEKETYLLLKHSGIFQHIAVHVPYNDILGCSKYTADFVLDNSIVLEVSSFTEAHHPEYYKRIQHKKTLVQNAGLIFVFCNTLAEVKEHLISS